MSSESIKAEFEALYEKYGAKPEPQHDDVPPPNYGPEPRTNGGAQGQAGGQAKREQDPQTTLPLEIWDAGDDPGPIPPREWLLGNQFCREFISTRPQIPL